MGFLDELFSTKKKKKGLSISGLSAEKGIVDARYNFVFCFLGINRTGKTSKARQIAKWWKESRPEGTIYVHDPQKKFTDIADYFIHPEDKQWAVKASRLKNCLLILDDVRMLHPGHTPIEGFQSLMYMRAENNIDIIYIVHNPSLILNLLSGFTTRYFIFYTLAREGTFENKIPCYELCMTASNKVNQYVNQHGRGQHPNFPYIVVDVETEKMSAYNMIQKPFL